MVSEQAVRTALAEVEDPEFPISIVDMGLIYGVRVDGGNVTVDVTFTSTGCPCTGWIKEDICARLLREPGVCSVTISDVWDPPWTVDRMTPKGRRALLQMGIAVS